MRHVIIGSRLLIGATLLLSVLSIGFGCRRGEYDSGSNATFVSIPTKNIAGYQESYRNDDSTVAPRHLCIFYGYPSYVNGFFDVEKAVQFFQQFDLIVFGDNLWRPGHVDFADAKAITSKLKALKPEIRIFGYVDLGVNHDTQNLPEDTLKVNIDGWKRFGVDGVFGDDFGKDFGVSRARQNLFIDYVHDHGLSVFANGWDPIDVLGGEDCHLGGLHEDYYLLESHLIDSGTYQGWSNFLNKSLLADSLGKVRGVKIASSSTLPEKDAHAANTDMLSFRNAWMAAAVFGFDAFQLTGCNYSTSSRVLFLPNPLDRFGSVWLDQRPKVDSDRHLLTRETDTHILRLWQNEDQDWSSEIVKK